MWLVEHTNLDHRSTTGFHRKIAPLALSILRCINTILLDSSLLSLGLVSAPAVALLLKLSHSSKLSSKLAHAQKVYPEFDCSEAGRRRGVRIVDHMGGIALVRDKSEKINARSVDLNPIKKIRTVPTPTFFHSAFAANGYTDSQPPPNALYNPTIANETPVELSTQCC